MIDGAIACVPPAGRSTPGPDDGGSAELIARELLATPILVIEDEAMIAWMLESLLEDMGFQAIALAPSADDAIAVARRNPPGLIISDINLGSGLDGIQAAAAIVGSRPIPAVFVTGYADDDARRRVGVALPDAVILRKPIQSAELRRAVLGVLRTNRSH